VLTVSGKLQYGLVAEARGEQDCGFNKLKWKVYGCIRPSYGLKPGQIKRNLLHGDITGLYSHSQPSTG